MAARGGSRRVAALAPSAIREMTLRNLRRHGAARAVDLAGGIPDFAPPGPLLAAAAAAIDGDSHQYPPPPGVPALREAIAATRAAMHGAPVDPETDVTVTCGTTEAMMAALLGVTDPGDEVVVVEPAYGPHAAACRLAGAIPRTVQLRPPAWRLDPDELRAACGPRTAAVLVNSPHNPTGRVLTRPELDAIAGAARDFDAVAITDEVYEHLVYVGSHVPLAALPGMAERTIAIGGASKSYSVTGWRLGWTVAPPALSAAVRAAHDLLTVGAATPLQEALVTAIGFTPAYYAELAAGYRERRDAIVAGLRELGFAVDPPEGAFYVLAGHPDLGAGGDVALAEALVDRAAVATVPLSAFYERAPDDVPALVRMTFAKRAETIERALDGIRAALA